jgi:hypothetical protein
VRKTLLTAELWNASRGDDQNVLFNEFGARLTRKGTGVLPFPIPSSSCVGNGSLGVTSTIDFSASSMAGCRGHRVVPKLSVICFGTSSAGASRGSTRPSRAKKAAVRRALEAAGIEFLSLREDSEGIRVRRRDFDRAPSG